MLFSLPAAFSNSFTGDVVTPADGQAYQESLERWAVNAKRQAAVVVFPKTANDVALALRHIDLPLAVKCGGHAAGGASSCENGMVVDMSRYFGGVRVDAEAKRAYIGGGAIWKTVDEAAMKHGLATVGGNVNHIGVGGHVLGGGYGWLSGRHGLAIDNLVKATVVTASGDIVEASETSNPDLFDGIRGGGSNFGIVTEFVLQLHVQRPTVYAGSLVFSRTSKTLDQLKGLLNDFVKTSGRDDGATLTLGYSREKLPIAVVTVFHNGTKKEGEIIFRRFLELGPVENTAADIPYESLNALFNNIAGFGLNRYFKGFSLDTAELLSADNATLSQAAEKQVTAECDVSLVLEFMPKPAVVSGDHAGRCAFRGRNTCNGMVLLAWNSEQQLSDAKAEDIACGLASTLNKPDGVAYSNYDCNPVDTAVQGLRAEQQFGSIYPRLQGIKAKYDPTLRFNRWFAIVPATSA